MFTLESGLRHDWELSQDELAEIEELSRQFWTSWESCLCNAQDMGYAPWSAAESREALRQMRNLVDAGEAS